MSCGTHTLLSATEALRPLLAAAEAVLGAEALALPADYLPSERSVTHVVLPTLAGFALGGSSPAERHALLCGLLTGKWVVPAAWLEESVRAGAFLPEAPWGVRIARQRPLCGIRVCLTPHFLAQLPTNAARREVKEVLETFGGATLLAPRYAAYAREAVVIRGDDDNVDGRSGDGRGGGETGGRVLTWGDFLDKLVLLGKTWMGSGPQ